MENTGYGDAVLPRGTFESAGDAGARSADREDSRLAGRGEQATNVNSAERILSLAGGAALALYGAKRKGVVGSVLALVGAGLVERGITGHCHVYGALGLNTADGDHGLERKHGPAATVDAKKAIKIEHSMTIDVAAPELYRFWRNFENLPRIMQHLESVTVIDSTHSHWKAKAPAGTTVEWDAEINNEIPDQLIGWKSVHEATVANAGSVHFTPAAGNRGTVVKVVLEYEPPAGKLGALVAKLLGEEPDVQVREDLRRFKAMMETGEAPTTDGQSSGRDTTS
jgi:uncharacterized membrane protein